MSDMECPYCGADQDVCHDDGFGYDESVKHEYQCSSCDKYFIFMTSISFHYEAEKADCLNGADHEMVEVCSSARNIWPDWKRCKHCEHEVRGQYVEPQ